MCVSLTALHGVDFGLHRGRFGRPPGARCRDSRLTAKVGYGGGPPHRTLAPGFIWSRALCASICSIHKHSFHGTYQNDAIITTTKYVLKLFNHDIVQYLILIKLNCEWELRITYRDDCISLFMHFEWLCMHSNFLNSMISQFATMMRAISGLIASIVV